MYYDTELYIGPNFFIITVNFTYDIMSQNYIPAFMSSKNPTVIFDMDGVLVNSEPLYRKMHREIYERLSIDIPDKVHETYIGISAILMWSDIKKRNPHLENEPEYYVQFEKKEKYRMLSETPLSPIAGITDFLNCIHRKNYRTAVASSSMKRNIKLVLEKTGLEKFFDFIISGEEIEHGKPSPDIFLACGEALNSDPLRTVVIEDSTNGVKAALAAGYKCAGFDNSDSGRQQIESADLIVSDFSQASIDKILRLIE